MRLQKRIVSMMVSSVIVLSMVFLTGPVATSTAASKPSPELQRTVKEAIQHHQQLESIKTQALANNPDLKRKWQNFQETIQKKISASLPAGASKEAQLQARMDAKKELQKDKEFMKQARQLDSAFKDAMRAVNPDVDNVLQNWKTSLKKVKEADGGSSLTLAPGYTCQTNVSTYEGCCGCCDQQWATCIALLPGFGLVFCDYVWQECLCLCFDEYIGSGPCPL
jgi:hypothetical protein